MSRFGAHTKKVEKVVLACDHAGYLLKNVLKEKLQEYGYAVIDKGAYRLDEDDDYTDFVVPAMKEVMKDLEHTRAIILGGSGQGEAIVANRFAGVRAVVFNGQYKPEDGRMVPHEIVISRQHNDANVLSLGARFLNEEEALHAVKLWLETPFSREERHVRRIKKIDEMTQHG